MQNYTKIKLLTQLCQFQLQEPRETKKETRKLLFTHWRGSKGLIKSRSKVSSETYLEASAPIFSPANHHPPSTHDDFYSLVAKQQVEFQWRALPLSTCRAYFFFLSVPLVTWTNYPLRKLVGLKEAHRSKNRRCSRKCSSSERFLNPESYTCCIICFIFSFLLFSLLFFFFF